MRLSGEELWGLAEAAMCPARACVPAPHQRPSTQAPVQLDTIQRRAAGRTAVLVVSSRCPRSLARRLSASTLITASTPPWPSMCRTEASTSRCECSTRQRRPQGARWRPLQPVAAVGAVSRARINAKGLGLTQRCVQRQLRPPISRLVGQGTDQGR